MAREGYVELAIPADADPDVLRQRFIASIQEDIPGWQPADGDIVVRVGDGTGEMAADREAMIIDVSRELFRKIGSELYGIVAIEDASATGTLTWAVTTDSTVRAGTQVTIDGVGFEVSADTDIETATPGTVPVVALTAGAAGTGVTGTVEVLDAEALLFTDTVTLDAATTGGRDAEAEDVYEDRLAARLAHLGRPTLPADFSDRARDITGVYRALTIDLLDPGVNERQTVTVTATGGTFTLTYSGQTTAAIAYNANAATVLAALEALSNLAPGDIVVTGGPAATSALTVEFTGTLAKTDVAQMTASGASLTGPGAGVAIATVQAGVADDETAERHVTVVPVDETGQDVSGATLTELQAYLDAEREINFVVNTIHPTRTTIDVAATITIWDGYTAADVLAAAEEALAAHLDPAGWGAPPFGDEAHWYDEPVVDIGAVEAAILSTAGVRRVVTVTLNGGTTDVTMTGPGPLPSAGTIAVTEAA